eukprot:jgi/Ulvmu1/11060/UM007_0242.1
MERSSCIHSIGPSLALLAQVVPQLVIADTTVVDSASSPAESLDDLEIVNTAEELLKAVNNAGVRHVVIRSHMNVTSSNSSSSTQLFREVLLRPPLSMKHIQGDCVEDHPTAQRRLARQCVLNVRQSFLEAAQQSSLRLVNLYVTSSPPFAPPTPPQPTAMAPAPDESGIGVQTTDDDEARYINYLEIYKADVWMYNVTLEGASQASVEGVNVLGASSTTGRAYAEGCLFTGFRSASGAAWSIHASAGRASDLPTAASFRDCAFTANTALSTGGAIFVERSGALRLENCTFTDNTAPDGANVAAEEQEPAVFSSPAITIFSEGLLRSAASQEVPSRPLAAAATSFDFLDKNDSFDAVIAQEFSQRYEQQALPPPTAAAPAPTPAPAAAPTVAAAVPLAPAPAPQPSSAAREETPAPAPTPATTAMIPPAPAAGEAARGSTTASEILHNTPGHDLIQGAGQSGGSSSLPETTLVATLAAAAVLAVFLVALLLFVSRHKARQRRLNEASEEVAQDRMAPRGPAISSGMDIVSSGPACATEDYHILYVLPRIQEEATGDLAATSSLMGAHSSSDST